MSMKSVEMQIAIPRTIDAGKLQEQLQQRGQNMMEHANETVKKDVEHNLSKVTKNEQTFQSKWIKEKEKQKHGQQKREKTAKGKNMNQKEHHPYKGKIIDYSG